MGVLDKIIDEVANWRWSFLPMSHLDNAGERKCLHSPRCDGNGPPFLRLFVLATTLRGRHRRGWRVSLVSFGMWRSLVWHELQAVDAEVVGTAAATGVERLCG